MRLLAPIIFLFLLTVVIKPTNNPEARINRKPQSCGYAIIASDKGVDCNGDTITLVKTNHGWERKN